MEWSKETDLISLRSAKSPPLIDPAARRNLDELRLPAPPPEPQAIGFLSVQETTLLKLVLWNCS